MKNYSRQFLIGLPVLLILTVLCIAGYSYFLQENLEWHSVKENIRKQFPGVSQLSTEELAIWLSDSDTTQPVLLDARALKEYETSHLRDAKFAGSKKDLLKITHDLKSEQPIVVYCSVGYRSSKLAVELQKRGLKNVYNLEGSIFQWANEGRPVYSKGIEVKQVHSYNYKWRQLLKKEFWDKSEKSK